MKGPYVVAAIACVVVWAFGVLGDYGWFTDELYYLACAKRPALGYADHPPLAPLVLAALRAIGPDELWLVRIVPALTFGATIVLAARLAGRLGGGAFAQMLAAVLVATAPAFLVVGGFFSMNPFDLLIAVALASVLVDIVLHDRPRLWLAVGALIGIGLVNKHTVVVPAGLFVLASLASPARRHLATRWPYLGAVLAIAIAAPHVAWLAEHDWVTLAFYAESTVQKNIETSALGALVGQLLFIGPLGFACAIAGAVSLLRHERLRGFGATLFVGLAVMMTASVSRPDRIAGLYPIALAAGAVAIDRTTRDRRTLRIAGLAVYALGVAVPLPIAVPVLPPATLASYAGTLGITPQLEKQKRGAVPQWFADRLAWPALVAQTAAVVESLPPEDRAHVVLLGHNYGVAGALEHLGPARGLHARVISTHNHYWAWSAPVVATLDARTIIVAVTDHDGMLRATFADVRRAGETDCELCFEDERPIWIARTPTLPLAVLWPGLQHLK